MDSVAVSTRGIVPSEAKDTSVSEDRGPGDSVRAAQLHAVFAAHDDGNKGFLLLQEFQQMMGSLGQQLSIAESRELVLAAGDDATEEVRVSFEQFHNVVRSAQARPPPPPPRGPTPAQPAVESHYVRDERQSNRVVFDALTRGIAL